MCSPSFSAYVVLLCISYGTCSLSSEFLREYYGKSFVENALVSDLDKDALLSQLREMFYFAYDNYMRHSYPEDELDPIHCAGRGHDKANKDNINVNDALGDYQLTLVDSLDTLAIIGNSSEFVRAVQLVSRTLTFTKNNTVQVFEATIRVLGGLLSAHMLVTDPDNRFGPLRPPNYDNELLDLAHELANRMLPNFYDTPTGVPHPRFNLGCGQTAGKRTDTCLAGAGTLLVEFGTLSALLQDPVYALVARRAVFSLWHRRSNVTGLFGSTIDVLTGQWINPMSGVGAGQDSFYEYLLKAKLLFDDRELGQMFEELLDSLQFHLRSGRQFCVNASGSPPVYWNVNMFTTNVENRWVDTLQAAWPAVLVLHGQLDEAICQHALHLMIWLRYGVPPERYNLAFGVPELNFYPLRPELAEATYFLYRATRHPFYLAVGKLIIHSIQRYTRTRCGFATVHDVTDKSKEDRMESFFLSETIKYLYLIFDEENPVHKYEMDYIFSTQAHIFPINRIRNLIRSLRPDPFKHSKKKGPGVNQWNLACERIRLNRPAVLSEEQWLELRTFVHCD